ncbi:glycosyltransferase, partial [Escherichia coli]|nr:glycosyltransferase [Escherichia coli]
MLTLAFSTIQDNLNDLLDYTCGLTLPDEVEIIIINQNFQIDNDHKEKNMLHTAYENINIYTYYEKGISLSRNRAIERCKTKYIWFLDDDVRIIEEKLNKLVIKLKSCIDCAYIVKIGSLEDSSLFYKNYKKRKIGIVNDKKELLRISSIEIICSMDVIIKNNLTFDTTLGLGTFYPCCEENKFIIEYYKYAVVEFLELTPVLHTTKREHRLSIGEGHYRSRGTIAKEFNFLVRIALVLRWSLRENNNVSFQKRITYLWQGIQAQKKTHIISPYESPAEGRGTRNIVLAKLIGKNCIFLCTRFSHGRKKILPIEQFQKVEGLNIRFISTISYKTNLSARRLIAHWFTATSTSIYLIVNTRKNDIVLVSSIPPEVILLVSIIQLIKKYQIVVDVRDIWPEAFPLAGMKGRIFSVYCKSLYKITFLLQNKKFIYVAPCFRKWISEYVPKNKVLDEYFGFLGFDENRWRSVQTKSIDWLDTEKIKLIYIGYLESQFDITDIIKYVRDSKKYELTIVGHGAKNEYYKDIASNSTSIHFKGLLPSDEVVNVMSDSHIGVLPITRTAQMPNKLFDYVGGCIPILSIGASDSSEFVKENDIGWNSDWGTNNIAQVLDNLTRNDILSKYN